MRFMEEVSRPVRLDCINLTCCELISFSRLAGGNYPALVQRYLVLMFLQECSL